MLYEEIFKKLHDENFEYLVVGGMAVNLHGYSRITNDLDLLILLTEENIGKFVKVIKSLGYRPKVPVELEDFISEKNRKNWIENKNMKVFSVYNPKNELEHIDVLIEYSLNFKKVYERKNVFNIRGIKIPTISIPDLIKLKKEAGRKIDELDINVLTRILELGYEREK